MTKMILEQSEHPLTPADLDELEKLYNWKFPESFRQLYLQYNGGYLPDKWMERNEIIFGGFDSIRYGELTAEQIYKDLIKSFPQLIDLFPFAYDQGGHSFLLSLRAKDYGMIYVFLMDGEELVDVSDTFDEFLEILIVHEQ